jgi:hypothetical protein
MRTIIINCTYMLNPRENMLKNSDMFWTPFLAVESDVGSFITALAEAAGAYKVFEVILFTNVHNISSHYCMLKLACVVPYGLGHFIAKKRCRERRAE